MDAQIEQPLTRTELAGAAEEKLLMAFFAMYRTARILEDNNATFQSQLNNLVGLIQNLSADTGEVTVKIVAGRYFVNDKLVPCDDDSNPSSARIMSDWRLLSLGGMTVSRDIPPRDLGRFFTFIGEVRPTDENVETLRQQLVSRSLGAIQLLSTKEVAPDKPSVEEGDRQKFRVMARKSFFQAMSVVQEVVVNTVQNREINIAKTKRVVHSLIDHITRDESSLIELSAIKDYDDYTYAHSTNVCVYALTLGVRMGIDRPRLSRLGFGALFHDIGKVKLPTDLIRKPDAFDENDWIQMQMHPLLGAKTILRNLSLTEHTARAARIAFEHHINNDFTGYPVLHYTRRETDLFSRIISIVDTFDALTSGRVYLKKAIPPDVVMKKMRFQMKVKFDPFLLKIFNDVIGIYPAGSLVLLNTDELALVLTTNEQDKARPVIKILGDKGGFHDKPVWADLTSAEHAHQSIIRLVEPSRYGLDMKDFILQD